MKWLAVLSASVLFGASYASADEWPPENTPSPGAQCYTVNEQTLHLTDDDYFSGQKFPRVLEKPEAGAKVVGSISAIFYVTWPLKIENGFVQVLHHIDKLGWIPERDVRPLRKGRWEPWRLQIVVGEGWSGDVRVGPGSLHPELNSIVSIKKPPFPSGNGG